MARKGAGALKRGAGRVLQVHGLLAAGVGGGSALANGIQAGAREGVGWVATARFQKEAGRLASAQAGTHHRITQTAALRRQSQGLHVQRITQTLCASCAMHSATLYGSSDTACPHLLGSPMGAEFQEGGMLWRPLLLVKEEAMLLPLNALSIPAGKWEVSEIWLSTFQSL